MNTNDYKQVVTYWGPGIPDGWGGVSYAAPVLLQCRWQETSERFLDSGGIEVVSRAKVWSKVDLEIGGYLILGDFTGTSDPTTLEKAYLIRMFKKIPDLRAMFFERISML